MNGNRAKLGVFVWNLHQRILNDWRHVNRRSSRRAMRLLEWFYALLARRT